VNDLSANSKYLIWEKILGALRGNFA